MSIPKAAHSLSVLVIGLNLATPGFAASYLSQAQLLSMLPGHTVSGLAEDGTKFVTNYGPGGRMGKAAGTYHNHPFEEAWYVQGNLWCENGGWGHVCYKVQQVDASTLQLYYNGKALKHTWSLK
ncbi:hypothetical protein [Solirhodobacter olei]|uniref:hypothetical protein n=1 Tax=Solirhodobacter olei TaxID=2493082 RepID=UPI000FD8CF38|nr:hypothetical protein [Solirhodobacter olei]